MASLTITSAFRAIACSAFLLLAACEQWHLTINGDGLLLVSVIGDDQGSDGRFRVRTRDANGVVRVVTVPRSGQVTLSPVSAGTLELTLLPPEGCTVTGPNPRMLTVSADETARVSFDVRCA